MMQQTSRRAVGLLLNPSSNVMGLAPRAAGSWSGSKYDNGSESFAAMQSSALFPSGVSSTKEEERKDNDTSSSIPNFLSMSSPFQSQQLRAFHQKAGHLMSMTPSQRRPSCPVISTPALGVPSLSLSRKASSLPEYVMLDHVAMDTTNVLWTHQHSPTWLFIALNAMFASGVYGGLTYRRNVLVLLLSSEIMMAAVSLYWLFGSVYHDDINGAVMFMAILTVSATETAVGLMFAVKYFHLRATGDVEALNVLK